MEQKLLEQRDQNGLDELQARMDTGQLASTKTNCTALFNLFYCACWSHLWRNRKWPRLLGLQELIPYEKHTEG
jgi:hypothetical protein